MKLIIGLGNPEPRYDQTRHNVGFILLDHVAKQHNATWQEKSKFKAHLAEITIAGKKALLLKPTTYYNLSGESVRAVADFYKLSVANDILIVHDELALPFGTLRTRLNGSDAGNNGIKSVIQHMGQDFARIRVGIANELTERADAADFVLGKFTTQELDAMSDLAHHTYEFIENFVHHEKTFDPTSRSLENKTP